MFQSLMQWLCRRSRWLRFVMITAIIAIVGCITYFVLLDEMIDDSPIWPLVFLVTWLGSSVAVGLIESTIDDQIDRHVDTSGSPPSPTRWRRAVRRIMQELRIFTAMIGIVLLGLLVSVGPYLLVHGTKPMQFDVLEMLLLIGSVTISVFMVFSLLARLMDAVSTTAGRNTPTTRWRRAKTAVCTFFKRTWPKHTLMMISVVTMCAALIAAEWTALSLCDMLTEVYRSGAQGLLIVVLGLIACFGIFVPYKVERLISACA